MTKEYFSKTRIRYSRFYGKPKNTLATLRLGDDFYFGIARCNKKEDRFKKDIGRQASMFRMNNAFEDLEHLKVQFYLDDSGLYGKCCERHLPYVLDYFYSIDR